MSSEPLEPVWLDAEIALAVHDRQLAEHGGGSGIRDPGMLDSALARPVNRWSYGDTDVASLAAAYAFGIARNHPFVDGNKRLGHAALEAFLILNGFELRADVDAAEREILAVAAGERTREQFQAWVEQCLTPVR